MIHVFSRRNHVNLNDQYQLPKTKLKNILIHLIFHFWCKRNKCSLAHAQKNYKGNNMKMPEGEAW